MLILIVCHILVMSMYSTLFRDCLSILSVNNGIYLLNCLVFKQKHHKNKAKTSASQKKSHLEIASEMKLNLKVMKCMR